MIPFLANAATRPTPEGVQFSTAFHKKENIMEWAWFVEDGDPREWPDNFRKDNDEFMASLLADYFHSHHDGWDFYWPLELTIISPTEQTTYIVDREAVPHFYATKKKQTP